MKNLKPGDIYILTKMATIRPGGLLAQYGLDKLEQVMPDSMSHALHSLRQLPEELTSTISDASPTKQKSEQLSSMTPDEELVQKLTQESKKVPVEDKHTGHDNHPLGRNNKNYNEFYEDEWKIPYGANFTVMPPYIQI